jgi:curved DNA-binding protein CbpA
VQKEIPLKGNFRDVGLANVLIFLSRNRLTGTLEVMTPSFTKIIYLNKGDAIFASSTYEDDRLGEMLLKAGKITVEQYDRSVEILKQTRKRQGAILVELGYLTPKELYWGVKYQVREIIYSLFLLEDGEYEFVQGDVPSDEVITLKMSMGNLIYEGMKRVDNWTRIRREMPAVNDVLMLSNDPFNLFQNIELSQQDRKILSLIDGNKTIKEIIDSSWIGSFEALKILYLLYSTGLIMKREDMAERAASITVDELLSELSEEEMAFKKRVEEFMKKIRTANYLEILEASQYSDDADIKKNYYRLVKEFHPDKYYNSDDSALKEQLTEIFDILTKAYNTIRESDKRSAYLRSLAPAGKKPSAQKSESQGSEKARAKDQYKRAVEEYKQNNYWGAADGFKWATTLDPMNSKYWSYYSLALSKIPNKLKQAEEALLQAIKLEPENAEYLVNLGLIYMKAGLSLRAKTQFEKALTLDPANEKAQKGLTEAISSNKK